MRSTRRYSRSLQIDSSGQALLLCQGAHSSRVSLPLFAGPDWASSVASDTNREITGFEFYGLGRQTMQRYYRELPHNVENLSHLHLLR